MKQPASSKDMMEQPGMICTKMITRKQKYSAHKALCKGRVDVDGNPIEFKLTFDEWCTIWDESGYWNQRGRRRHEYVMSRIDDRGHYEVGNVIIQTQLENMKQKQIKNPYSVKVKTPEGLFKSLSAAAKHYNVDRQTITNWCNSSKEFDRF
jgi:hypothetical protein